MFKILASTFANRLDRESMVVPKKYLKWLASFLAEDCNCELYFDHSGCIAEAEEFMQYFQQNK